MMDGRRNAAFVLLLSLVGAVVCAAQEKDRDRERGKDDRKPLDIQVWSIRATTKNKDISPELKKIADDLKKQFKFTGFKLDERVTGSAELSKTYATQVSGGYQVKVTPQKRDEKRVTMQVEVYQGKERKLSANVTVKEGQFQLLGGLPLDGGDQLIIAVSAR